LALLRLAWHLSLLTELRLPLWLLLLLLNAERSSTCIHWSLLTSELPAHLLHELLLLLLSRVEELWLETTFLLLLLWLLLWHESILLHLLLLLWLVHAWEIVWLHHRLVFVEIIHQFQCCILSIGHISVWILVIHLHQVLDLLLLLLGLVWLSTLREVTKAIICGSGWLGRHEVSELILWLRWRQVNQVLLRWDVLRFWLREGSWRGSYLLLSLLRLWSLGWLLLDFCVRTA